MKACTLRAMIMSAKDLVDAIVVMREADWLVITQFDYL